MKWMRIIGLAALLAACDEATVISHVDRLSHMTRSDLFRMQDGRGIPVEFHGLPFPGVAPEALSAALRGPTGTEAVRFYPAAPGGDAPRAGWRLVLHFNPAGPPNAVEDCRRRAPAETRPPQEKGFTVNASFCEGDAWQAHGYLQALEARGDDLGGFTDAMRQLFLAIFPENTDPDR